MLVDVAWLPALLPATAGRIVIMVDVLRVSTTMCVVLEQGATRIRLAAELDEARAIACTMSAPLLCGERGGLPPADFDYGNSPSEFSRLDLTGRDLVICTSNGTRAMQQAAGAPLVLVGALRNASAVVDVAVRAAVAQVWGITILCAGRALGKAFGLDDAYCAGALVERLLAHPDLPPPDTAADPSQLISGGAFQPKGLYVDETATAALRLHQAYQGNAIAALQESGNGQGLLRVNLDRDLEFCARTDASSVVPHLQVSEDGELQVVPYGD